ncbi:peptidoglycan D,D-transpeptidase FtsI family protein [Nocardioides terrisoli]|uniref:peptidoglycan D,D-transpeptidase FtsI family protein n=1 Tax=Nocardioides terrisoli TaxID=3388267 RepID=UPI00287B785D|nr:penicillin-binding protein 2 [Nocardioides marmorisolisilvae]
MNRPIRVLAVGCMVLFLALLLRSTYVQYWEAKSLDTVSRHENNIRVIDAQFSRQRGAIVVNGKAIAVSKKSGDRYKYQRTYPQGPEYADLTGYFTRDWGLGGIESSQNTLLSGEDDSLFLNRMVDLVNNRRPKGGSVVLTINPAAQKAAYDGLKGKIGAVVALQPDTGKVLAMASSPTYDPNKLATHRFDTVGKYKTRLLDKKPSPLNNIGIETVVPPGSTFKLVTLSAALSSGRFNPDSLVPGASSMKLPQSTHLLHNENNFACGAGKVTLTVALEKSCNVAFGTVGEKLGIKRLADQSKKFGFSLTKAGSIISPNIYFHDLDDPITRQSASRFPADADPPHTVLSAIGQGDDAATPLQMAMVAAGIANNGTVMRPYLVSETDSPDLDVLSKTTPKPIADQPAISPSVAEQVTDMMVQVVDNGTGTPAQIPGVEVAGKTGTAQSEASRPPYAWFVSFAPAQNPQVAVAVLIQDAGVARDQISGGGLAAPIAKAVMEAVMHR